MNEGAGSQPSVTDGKFARTFFHVLTRMMIILKARLLMIVLRAHLLMCTGFASQKEPKKGRSPVTSYRYLQAKVQRTEV